MAPTLVLNYLALLNMSQYGTSFILVLNHQEIIKINDSTIYPEAHGSLLTEQGNISS